MRDNEPENFRSLLIQKQLDDGADQHQGAADKMMNVGASWPRSFIPIKNMTADSSANNAPATTRMATTATPPLVSGRRCRLRASFSSITKSK